MKRPYKDRIGKTFINMRLDNDTLAHFKAGGPGYQTRINAFLRGALDHDQGKDEGRQTTSEGREAPH